MLNKYLLIALGGAAEKLVRYLNQDVERRLAAVGWKDPVPDAWRWLCVDVAQRSDVATVGDVPKRLGETGTRIGLAAAPYEYDDYLQQVTSRTQALPALAGCLPDPSLPLPPPYKGAGQRPQVGYTVGLSELARLSVEINRQIVALDTQRATQQLTSLSRLLRPHEEGAEPGVTVIVASSLGGGSGASLVQLVVELLLGSATLGAQWLRPELSTLLFTPDIFVDLTPLERDGVQANSLHTIAAMLNGYEWNEELPPSLGHILGTGGATLRDGRRAATTNFYIGGRNVEIAFDHQNKVIKATATALGRLMVDQDVAAGLAAHLDTNRNGAPVLPEFRIVEAAATSRPASSLGYASVSLGHDTLEQYAAERLARAQLDVFRRGHLRAREEGEREDKTIERIADDQLPALLERAHLRKQDIIAALFDEAHVEREVTQLVRSLRADIRSGKKRGSIWHGELRERFSSLRAAFDAKREQERVDGATAWSKVAGTAVVEAATEVLGRHGAPVAAALLQAAGTHLRDLAEDLRDRDSDEARTAANRLIGEAEERITTILNKVLRGTDGALADACAVRGKALIPGTRLAVYDFAAMLVVQFDAAVLVPLQQAIEAGEAKLAESELRHHRKLVDSWSAHAVPPRLHPAPNELLLDPVESIPALFERLLGRTVERGDAIEDATVEAVAELLTHSWMPTSDLEPDPVDEDRDGQRPHLVVATSTWVYGDVTTAAYKVDVDAEDLLAAAHRWVRRRRGALAERLKLPLGAWIERKPEHADAFVDALEQAMRCAAPLVSVNPAVHLRVHGMRPEQPKLYLGALPIADDHRIRRRVEESLRNAGISDGRIAELFDPTAPVSAIEISGFLAQPVHPIVLDGLFVPIQRDWQTRTNPSMRRQFAVYRRTRSLPHFVPLSPANQRRFVMGWIAAEQLRLLDPLEEPWSVRPLSVWTPQGPRTFPAHLLGGDVTNAHEVLGGVLESLPLALASYAAQHFEELEAYMRILDLGELEVLRRWILTGGTERAEPGVSPAPTPAPELTATPDEQDTAAAAAAVGARWQAAQARIDAFVAPYAWQQETIRPTRANLRTLPPSWEIGELVQEAAERMRAELRRMIDPDGNGGAVAMQAPLP